MSSTPGVEVGTTCDQCGKCALKDLKGLLKGAAPSAGFGFPNPHALPDVTGFQHPDDSKGYKTFGSGCKPDGNCGRQFVGGLYTRTFETAQGLIPKIEQRAREVGMNVVARGRIFVHRFII